MESFEDYYEILQVHHLAEPEVVKAAYRKLLEKYHPDHNSSPVAEARTRQIIRAYDVLKEPVKRRLYDVEWLRHRAHITGPGKIPEAVTDLQIDRDVIEFNVIPDLIPQPQVITLKNTGKGNLDGGLVPRQKWIKVSPRAVSFDDKQSVQIQIDTSKLTTDIMGYVDIRTTGGNKTITVKAVVNHPQEKTRKKRRIF
jgi:curved DNA-binding protein CbpA